jgi:SSS family transporter
MSLIVLYEMSSIVPVLTQSDGYEIIVGLGALFAVGMVATTYCLKRFHDEATDSSENFSTANGTVKTSLIASAVVSSWTWAATLLQSTSVAYLYGISGPFWYASGATVQIILFCVLAIELKRRAPFAHTFLEVVHARYGRMVHLVFIAFCICTNIVVTAMLLTGGSAVVHSLSGMHIAAACFLLPIGTIIYTMFGGIKATFLTDYAHTVAVIIIILFFTFVTYVTSPLLGSTSKVYDLLVNASQLHPVKGNAEGSYLTMRSKEGAMFFVINLIGNFGTVFLDNGYYNKAIAASPVSALPGYILGGISWFAVPFLAATTMGLAAVALESNPAFPTYPNRLNPNDVLAGLTLPAAAVTLLGKNGAIATLIMIFMAVTSAMSAQLIAVSSVITYDVYKIYFNPTANGKKLINISHISVIAFGLIMSVISIGLYYINIDLGYLYLFMGVIISSAVIPGALTLLWNRQSKWAACLSPLLGVICSISAWLITTKVQFGSITVRTSGSNISMLIGNVVALCSPILFVPVLSLIMPDKEPYDFNSMKEIKRDDEESTNLPNISPEEIEREIILLLHSSKVARITAIVLTLCLIVLWPWPMYGTGYIFSKSFFNGWILLGIIWMFISFIIVGIYPIIEGRHSIASVYKKIYDHIMTHTQHNNDNMQMNNETKMTYENSCNSNSELCM